MKLRPYQEKAINMTRSAVMAGNKKVCLQLPTGSGKTVIAAHMIKTAISRGRAAIMIVDRIELANQTSAKLDAMGIKHGVMQGDNPRRDDSQKCQVASIQTIAKRGIPESLDPSLIIIDECHVMYSAHHNIVSAASRAVVVGLTATPWARGMGDHFSVLVRPVLMDEMISDGYLCDARVLVPSDPDLSGIGKVGDDYNQSQLSERLVADVALAGKILETWMDEAEGKPTLIMAASIEHSQMLTAKFATDGGVSAAHIDAYTDRDTRRFLIGGFKSGQINVLSSVGVLTTGFDAPNAETLILARPTMSKILHVQMIGRVLRPSPETGKSRALILDHAGNFHRLGWHSDINYDRFLEKGERLEEPETRDCPKCGAPVSVMARICPICGFELAGDGAKVCYVETKMVELIRQSSGTPKGDYINLLQQAEEKGYKPGWSAYRYKEKTGRWPDRAWFKEWAGLQPRS